MRIRRTIKPLKNISGITVGSKQSILPSHDTCEHQSGKVMNVDVTHRNIERVRIMFSVPYARANETVEISYRMEQEWPTCPRNWCHDPSGWWWWLGQDDNNRGSKKPPNSRHMLKVELKAFTDALDAGCNKNKSRMVPRFLTWVTERVELLIEMGKTSGGAGFKWQEFNFGLQFEI